MRIALVNTNRMRPPITPIGLEYVAETLSREGHFIEILDLCFNDDLDSGISGFFNKTNFDLVGLTLRNTDDCAFTSRESFIGDFAAIISKIRGYTDASIVVGGVGFSVMPELVLKRCKADVGICRDGEFALPELAKRIEKKEKWSNLQNLIFYHNGTLYQNPAIAQSLEGLPPMNRGFFDNKRYFIEGGQAGFETKRGCIRKCIYCPEPQAKGKETRIRPPKAVAYELKMLLADGIDHLHTCDSEFNDPMWHAIEVCREIIRQGLGDKLRWYAYCSPLPFSAELARLMHRAGCVGINFGVDNGDSEMLKRLRRDFMPDDILNTVNLCKDAGIAVMLDLLIGSPGEEERSIINTVELMKRLKPDRVGFSIGVRVYPGTTLSRMVMEMGMKEGLLGGDDLLKPVFYLEPKVAPFVFELLDRLIGEDPVYFFFDPSKPERNYNYNQNTRLIDAIRKGYRGAYWDILRRYGDKYNPN